MGILRDLERRLEGAVEGLFGRVFRSGVQPVELSKRLRREMADNKKVGIQRLYVPNVYVFELSEQDTARFANYSGALEQELASTAVKYARDNDWAMLGRVKIELTTSADLIEGRFNVTSRVEADEQEERGDFVLDTPAPAGPRTAMLPGEIRADQIHAPASLTLITGARKGQGHFPLKRNQMIMGRATDADIALTDTGISRHHARIVREGDDFVVEDLGSTNGTEVNGQPVKRRRLADGDRVRLGNSTLQFRRER